MPDEITREEFVSAPGISLKTVYFGIRRQQVTFTEAALEQLIHSKLADWHEQLVTHDHWAREFEWGEDDDGKVVCIVTIEQVIERRPEEPAK